MKAVACTIERLERHPNADRLQIAIAAGTQVIVGPDAKIGDPGILVPAGAQLSAEFCLANKLFRKHPVTGEPLGGYLDERGRVVALRLRGADSEGLFLGPECLGMPMSAKPGEEIDTWQGGVFVQKYVSPAARAAVARRQGGGGAPASVPGLPRHYDTAQARHNLFALCHALNDGAALVVTEKLHGTSGRTGSVSKSRGLVASAAVRVWNAIAGRLGLPEFASHEVVSGTRNCILDANAPGEIGAGYRRVVHAALAPCLRPGEVWYYEIVGFDDGGRPIMPPHSLSSDAFDKPMRKRLVEEYGETVTYSYGCSPTGKEWGDGKVWRSDPSKPGWKYAVFVYRITDRDGRELTIDQITWRVEGARLRSPHCPVYVVPTLCIIRNGLSPAGLLAWLDAHTRGRSTVGDHFREGVCVRAEWHNGDLRVGRAFKHKSFVFTVCEGIAANDVAFVDLEDVS